MEIVKGSPAILGALIAMALSPVAIIPGLLIIAVVLLWNYKPDLLAYLITGFFYFLALGTFLLAWATILYFVPRLFH